MATNRPQMEKSEGAARIELKKIGDRHDGVFLGTETRKIDNKPVKVLNFADADFDGAGKFEGLNGKLSEMLYATDLEKKVLPFRGHYFTIEFVAERPTAAGKMRIFDVFKTPKPVVPAAKNNDTITDDDIPF